MINAQKTGKTGGQTTRRPSLSALKKQASKRLDFLLQWEDKTTLTQLADRINAETFGTNEYYTCEFLWDQAISHHTCAAHKYHDLSGLINDYIDSTPGLAGKYCVTINIDHENCTGFSEDSVGYWDRMVTSLGQQVYCIDDQTDGALSKGLVSIGVGYLY